MNRFFEENYDVVYEEEINYFPKTIEWHSFKNLNYPPKQEEPTRWGIYAEKNIKIKPKDVHRIALGLGYEMSKGVICASIISPLKNQLTLLNGLYLDQKTENTVICLYNFSQETVSIQTGELFAFVKYLKQ